MKSNRIKHIRCSLYHPSSNEAAERLVQTCSSTRKISLSEALWVFVVLKQQLRSCLDLLQPTVQETVETKQAQQKQNHDVHTKQRDLSVGTPIMAKNFTSNPQWLPGVVMECVASLTYSIQLQDGSIWRRHIDYVVVTNSDQGAQRSVLQNPCEESCDDWSYTYSDSADTMTRNNQTATSQLTTEGR